MNFGYKLKLAVILATASIYRTHGQTTFFQSENTDSAKVSSALTSYPERQKDNAATFHSPMAEVQTSALPSEHVSNHILNERDLAKQRAELYEAQIAVKDSLLEEEIYQDILELEPQLLRFMALSEDIKFVAYKDRTANIMTIANGLTKINGRPVRRGDVINEQKMIEETRKFFRTNIVPSIAKYLQNWKLFEPHEKIVLLDMFWNNGIGKGVLLNGSIKDPYCRTLSDAQRQEIADSIKNNNNAINYNGHTISMRDLPEWRNLGINVKTSLSSLYSNNNITRGDDIHHFYNEKMGILQQSQRLNIANLLLEQKKEKENGLINRWSPNYVNDSTIRYRDFLIDQTYTLSDVSPWDQLNEKEQEEAAKKLADANKSVLYNGHRVSANDLPAWDFLSKKDRQTLERVFKGRSLLQKNSKNQSLPLLTGLCCELNLYLVNKTPENRERVATRIASFVHSGNKVVTGLLKRANFRALVFSGQVSLDASEENSIDLNEIHIGAISSAKISDFNNPQTFCDTVMGVKAGRTYEDTIAREKARIQHRPAQWRKQASSQSIRIRSGARGR